jgi:hypothetical protein
MPSRFIKLIAVTLIVLGASPFTAPFSTCDWRMLTGHDQDQSDRPSSNENAHGAVVKTTGDPDDAPVLAATAASTTPLFSFVSNEAPARGSRVSSQRILLLSLRI